MPSLPSIPGLGALPTLPVPKIPSGIAQSAVNVSKLIELSALNSRTNMMLTRELMGHVSLGPRELALLNLAINALEARAKKLRLAARKPPTPTPPGSWGMLGDILFERLDAPLTFDHTVEAEYAEFAMFEGKPRLQRVGTKLEEASMQLRLHPWLQDDPDQRLRDLKDLVVKGEPQDLVIGAKDSAAYSGRWLVTRCQHNRIENNPDGSIRLAEVTIQLREYVPPANLAVSKRTAPPPAVKPKPKKKPINRGSDPTTSGLPGGFSEIK